VVFSSATFVFYFLPLFLLAYYALPFKNLTIVVASLVFYFWGETWYTAVIVTLAAVTYLVALGLASRPSRALLALGICIDLGALIYFKYSGFLLDNLNPLLQRGGWPAIAIGPVHLPLGLSFVTFHVLSYLIDVYRKDVAAERGPLNVALYVSMFPQLIAGPIIRFKTIAHDIHERTVTDVAMASGVGYFIVGLGQKLIVANTAAVPADQIFALDPALLDAPMAWLGALAYTIQIYFDFCGYSNMAIGLALMIGLHFPINFNYPYVSRSITEFWRRWHMTLSAWFRDYLYIPLGGNRKGRLATYRNLMIVFLLCGAWHGAEWTFVVWGIYHGAFLVLERLLKDAGLRPPPRIVQHAYALLVIVVGWAFFRSATIGQAVDVIAAMAGAGGGSGGSYSVWQFLPPDVLVVLLAGMVGSTPVIPWLGARLAAWAPAPRDAVAVAALGGVLLASAMQLAAGTYNPFIYFRF